MDQEQRQEVVKPEDLVHKLRPWWGIAIASLLSLGITGGVIAIHFAGAVTPAKKEVSYQKADDTWIDREPDHAAHTESSVAPAASATATPPAQAAATPMPQYQAAAQNYVPPAAPNPAVEQRRQEYAKALASDLLVAPTGQSQVLETPRLVSAGGEPIEGQNSDATQSGAVSVADPHPASPYTITTGTVIYGTLETGINSDLPGDVLGRVAQDVKDSVNERYVLIPQGSSSSAPTRTS